MRYPTNREERVEWSESGEYVRGWGAYEEGKWGE